MKKSDAYSIALKVFGIYFLWIILADVKQMATMWAGDFGMGYLRGTDNFDFIQLAFPYFINLGCDILFAWIFLYRANYMAKLILNKEPDSEISFGVNRSGLIQVACMIVGGLMVANAVEQTGNTIIGWFQYSNANFDIINPVPEFIWHIVLGIAGYALITSSGAIGRKFSKAPEDKKSAATASEAKYYFGQWKVNRPVKGKMKKPVKASRKSSQK